MSYGKKTKIKYMKFIESFLDKGVIEFGNILDAKQCNEIYTEILKTRDWSQNLFRNQKEVMEDPDPKNTNPGKGVNNLAEKYDLTFVETNPILKENIEKLIGADYEILLKNFVVGVPDIWIPEWLKKITEKQLTANLGPYIKKEFRDVTYFRGIDYHMDLIDHANAVGDNLTLYVYLNDVDANMSPLHIIEKSHIFGGTKFPHFLKNDIEEKIEYGSSENNFKKFNKKILTGKTGNVYLWSSFILHGTRPQSSETARISLRYDIKKNSKNNNANLLINEFLKRIDGNLSLTSVRDDIDLNSSDHKQVKFKKILK